MKYYNAIQASRILGLSDKTIRRYIEKGRLEAIRKRTGELAIPEDEVKKLRRELEAEWTQFGESRPERHSSHMVEAAGQDIIELSRQVEALTARVVQIEATVHAHQSLIFKLTQRINELEAQPATHQKAEKPPVSLPTAQNSQPSAKPQNRSVERSGDLPPGTLHWREFAAQIGIKDTVLEGIIRRGIGDEWLERIEVPTAKEGQTTKYFSPEQAEKAIEVLRRHHKI